MISLAAIISSSASFLDSENSSKYPSILIFLPLISSNPPINSSEDKSAKSDNFFNIFLT